MSPAKARNMLKLYQTSNSEIFIQGSLHTIDARKNPHFATHIFSVHTNYTCSNFFDGAAVSLSSCTELESWDQEEGRIRMAEGKFHSQEPLRSPRPGNHAEALYSSIFSPYRPKVAAIFVKNMNLSFTIWTIDGYRLGPYPCQM